MTQGYQKPDGTLQVEGKVSPFSAASLRGDQLGFNVGGARYADVVKDEVIEGNGTQGATTQLWRTTRGE